MSLLKSKRRKYSTITMTNTHMGTIMKRLAFNTTGTLRNCLAATGLAILALATPLPTTSIAMAENGVIHLKASQNTKTMKITKSKPKTVRTDRSFSEIVVGDPEVASVSPLTDRSFYVIGTAPGTTGIALYDEDSNLVGLLDIEVGANTNQINAALNEALPKSKVKATTTNGRVVLKGKANGAVAAAKARAIAKKFDPELVDTVKVEGSQQVNLEVRFIEARRNNGKELGINLNARRATGGAAANVIDSTLTTLVTGGLPFGQFVTRIIEAGTNVDLTINALEDRNLVRSLAEPNLVALSGDTASFLAGGEFPIPVAQDGGSISVEFKPFGVGLKFTPTVLDNGLINLKLAPEVSEIDTANQIEIGNNLSIPGLVVRRAETTLELRDGQTFVLGGLLQKGSKYNKRQLPWLGDVPILGALFRSADFKKSESDLVIIVTPRLVKPLRPGEEPATPLDATAPASEVDLFANGNLEVKRSHLRTLAAAKEGALKSGHIIELE
jgi:pilus assembly protein CpaC